MQYLFSQKLWDQSEILLFVFIYICMYIRNFWHQYIQSEILMKINRKSEITKFFYNPLFKFYISLGVTEYRFLGLWDVYLTKATTTFTRIIQFLS